MLPPPDYSAGHSNTGSALLVRSAKFRACGIGKWQASRNQLFWTILVIGIAVNGVFSFWPGISPELMAQEAPPANQLESANVLVPVDNNDHPTPEPFVEASLLDAFADQASNVRSLDALRTLQRAFRKRTSTESDSLCLQEILRLAHLLQQNIEFQRYAQIGGDEVLTDKKIALRAAVRLTDLRKYSLAADYYNKWLQLNSQSIQSYLYVLVLIEKGRLHYLANEFGQAEAAFRKVLQSLDSNWISAEQKKQLLRNSDTTYRMMANTFLKTGDHQLARKMFDLAGIDQDDPIRFFNEAQIALALGETEKADQWVHRFIAKQPNHSDSYRLLHELHVLRNDSDKQKAESEFVSDLELIRKKFRSGRVLDDFLVSQYLKQNETQKARDILEHQRSSTLWRDRANRLLLDIAFREKNLHHLIQAVTIEADEHQDLAAIRKILAQNKQQVAAWSGQLMARYANAEVVAEKIAIASLLMSAETLLPTLAHGIELIRIITADQQVARERKTRQLMLLGREAVFGKRYRFALQCFDSCLKLNQGGEGKWIEERVAFEGLLSSALVNCHLGNEVPAMSQIRKAETIIRSSPALMHLKGWAKIQFADFGGALVEFDHFLNRFDKSGASRSLTRLSERVRLEMAYALFLLDKKTLSVEVINEVLDRNPLGPDLEAFERNNQKYKKKIKLFLNLVNGVKDGGPLPLGRN